MASQIDREIAHAIDPDVWSLMPVLSRARPTVDQPTVPLPPERKRGPEIRRPAPVAPRPKIARRLRKGVLAISGMALLAFTVRWSVEHRDEAWARPGLILSDAPSFIVDTLGDLVSDPFSLSRVPDSFGAHHRYTPLVNHTTHDINGLVMRTGDSASAPASGWRLLYGIFAIDGAPRHALLVISPSFAIEHVWLPEPEPLEGIAFGQAPYPHGFALLKDGSIIAAFDDSQRTLRIGYCGEKIWSSPASLHHALYPDAEQKFAWGVGSPDTILKIDLATGKLMGSISMEAIRAANPDVTALDMRRREVHHLGDNVRDDAPHFLEDPYHLNDAEPLPAALAANYPAFKAGDLLVSLRNLNLVFVLDPQSLRIKWLTNDTTLRQHDPDWTATGEISVLDNRMGRHASRIVGFDPATGSHRTILDGSAIDFYTRMRGKHQMLPDGGVLIASTQQGRIVETGPDGKVRMEMLAQDPAHPGRNFVVSEASFSPDTLSPLGKDRQCPKP